MTRSHCLARIVAPLAALVIAVACGGGDDAADGTGGPSEATPSATAGAGPEALADQMVADYVEMTEAYVDLLEQDLPPAALATEIADLKDEYIDRFVDIGYQREAMSDDEVAAFNSQALSGIFALEFDHQDMVNEVLAELNAAGESDLASEINSLNILTQYAQFELLWDQEPDEAERLALPSPLHTD